MTKNVTINDETWCVLLSADNELSFSHLSRVEDVTENGWLWRDWTGDAAEMVEELFECHTRNRVAPLVLRTHLLEAAVELIKSSRTWFFFFEATTPQLRRIYAGMMSRLLEKLGGDWVIQEPDPTWFFFLREDRF